MLTHKINPVKITLKLALATLAAALAAAPFVRAQDDTAAVPVAPSTAAAGKGAKGVKGAKGANQGARDQVAQRDTMLAEKLNLTDPQKQQLADLRAKQAEELKAAKGDRAKMASLAKSAPDQVRALLTPEQQKLFDAIKPEGSPGKAGAPKAKKAGKL